jgi:hypothetical protein
MIRDYCSLFTASLKPWKEFVVTKRPIGFNFSQVETRIREIISNQAPYSGNIQLRWETTSETIIIRSPGKGNEIFSLHVAYKVILSILLIYPIMLLLRLFFFGSRWDTVRIAFPIQQYRYIKATSNVTSIESARSMLKNSWESQLINKPIDEVQIIRLGGVAQTRDQQGEDWPEGCYFKDGIGEDEWVEKWKWGVIDAVRTKQMRGARLEESRAGVGLLRGERLIDGRLVI